jgi:four helix bundle protein
MAQSYKDLIAWQKSMQLVAVIYRETVRLPKEEVYGITSQLRRAATSIPCNIAEGQGRLTSGEFQQFLGYARGSLLELETLILIARDLGYIHSDTCTSILASAAEVGKILDGLLNSISKTGN